MTTKKSGGGKKETSDKMSTIASNVLRGKTPTKAETLALAACVLGQDETKGKRTK